MKNVAVKVLVIFASMSFIGCAGMGQPYRNQPVRNFAIEGQALQDARVDAKTLKYWETHVSDDTLIIDISVESSNRIKATAK